MPPLLPAGAGTVVARMEERDLRAATVGDLRGLIVADLPLSQLDAGSPHLPTPIYTSYPGVDAPELRVDGRGVAPLRWPETSLAPVPDLALKAVLLRRATPIDGPLSATGGPVCDLVFAEAPRDRAESAIRLTRSSYGTFTEEIVLRRPIGGALFSGFYGDSKSAGRDLWQRQDGQTLGARLGHSLAGGYVEWSVDDAYSRARLLSSKKAIWDRQAVGARWRRSFVDDASVEADASWSDTRGGWWTARGLTERRTRAVRVRTLFDKRRENGGYSAAIEAEGARTRYGRPGEAHDVLKDLSAGAALGYETKSGRREVKLSAGVVRLAPLGVAPVFALETSWTGSRSIDLYAARGVRHRTLPRMPADGEAWVRQGIDLAVEDEGESPESITRAGFSVEMPVRRLTLRAGADGTLIARGLRIEEGQIEMLGTDQQDLLPASSQRRTCRYVTPWSGLDARLPLGIYGNARGWLNSAQGGKSIHLGLPGAEAFGRLGCLLPLFKHDLILDLRLTARGRGAIATPYGSLAPFGSVDGEIRGRLGDADIFFVLANLTDAVGTSMSYDGRFMFLPRRHYRAGLAWRFID